MKKFFPLALVLAAGCSSHYEVRPDPEPAPPAASAEAAEIVQLVALLGAEDAEARTESERQLEEFGLRAAPWIFAGYETDDPERQASCLELLERLRRMEHETVPPVDVEFAARLKKCIEPGHALRSYAFSWLADILRAEESRRIVPEPSRFFRDGDPHVRRCAATLHIRYGNPVRKLIDILPDVFEETMRSRKLAEEWDEVLIALCASAHDETELSSVRRELRAFADKAKKYDEELAWWEVRKFFQRAGPAAEPLLADILLKEPAGDLRRLAAIAYGPGRALVSKLEEAWDEKPGDDLAIALGNAGSRTGIGRLAVLLAQSAAGSRDRWAAALALEGATGQWHGDPAEEEDVRAMNAAWAAVANGSVSTALVSFRHDEGGAFLAEAADGWRWQVAAGPFDFNLISRDEPRWAVFHAGVSDPSCAGEDLLLVWSFGASRFEVLLIFFVGAEELPEARARAERMIARAAAAASGVEAGATLAETVDRLRAARAPSRQRDRLFLADPTAPLTERALAARRLALGTHEDTAALAELLASRPHPAIRSAAYTSLYQMDTLDAWLVLAENVADGEATIDYMGTASAAAEQLLRIGAAHKGVSYDDMDAALRNPEKWSGLVRQAFGK